MKDRESEIRAKLEKSLNRPIYETTWENLKADEWIVDHVNGSLSWDDLKGHVIHCLKRSDELINEVLDAGKNGVGRQRPMRQPGDLAPPEQKPGEDRSARLKVKFNSWESSRAEAHTEYVAELANRSPLVREFRAKVLGGAYPLTHNQALYLVRSPATAFFPFEWFESWGIPIVGSVSVIEGKYFTNKYGTEVDHRVTLRFDGLTSENAPEGSPVAKGKVRVRYALGEPPEEEKIDAQTVHTEDHPSHGTEVVPPYPDYVFEHDERTLPSYIWPGSIQAALKFISKELSKFYWRTERGESEAAWFILTGEPTLIYPLEIDSRIHKKWLIGGLPSDVDADWSQKPFNASIKLTVHPWMSADRVREIYRDAQRQVMGNVRQPWERNLKAYIFIKFHGLEDREGESEPYHMYEVQAAKGESYKTPHGFWQAYRNAKEKVEDFPYRRPKW